jgi:hypothetical protein
MIIKVISEEIVLSSTPNSIGGSRVVRIYNDSGSDVLVTRRNSANTVLGSCTLANGSIQFMKKAGNDTLESSANVKATSVAYTIS